MKIIPYDKFDIELSSRPDEVLDIISNVTESDKLFKFSEGKEFSGSITENGFVIRKNITYRNSFLPIIEGEVKPSYDGILVTITMRLHTAVLCFMCFWFTGVGIACINVLANLDNFSNNSLIPFGMLLFGLGMVIFGFGLEAPKQKNRIVNLLTEQSTTN
ncbi:hypothetical protein [Kangiella marina]|uniref:Uncharacterized protein n=1 Tax=Kangiella marina TaxID=1079178 RepID=A0ABP8IK46_9GAMM